MQKIVTAKRIGDKNTYYFLQNDEIKTGDKIVVDFEEFQTVLTVLKTDIEIADSKAIELKKIVRKATEKDLKKFEELCEKTKKELPLIKKKSLELGLMMKFVSAEYSLDGSKIVIVFSSEERVDFRQFLKDLASMLKTRIELKQIGQRDEVKIIGGVGPCGQPCCCARFLNDFEHVTVKMAKIQGLSLSPTKINGICGRLMCCLGYETKHYEETLAKMPKVNSEVFTPKGKGIVVYNDILRERVSVKRQAESDSFVVEDYELEEIRKDGEIKKPAKKKETTDSLENKEIFKKEEPKNNENKEQKNTQPSTDKKGGFNKNFKKHHHLKHKQNKNGVDEKKA